MERIFSFGERFHSTQLRFVSPHEDLLTNTLINIHYLYTIYQHDQLNKSCGCSAQPTATG